MTSDSPTDGCIDRFTSLGLCRFTALIYAAFLTLAAYPLSSPAVAQVTCSVVEISVVDAQPDDAEMVCEIAADVSRFMQRYGAHAPPRPTTVHVVERLSRAPFASTIGTFDAAHNRIEILTYTAARRVMPTRPAFGIPMNRDLYRSFVAHEIAHAVAHPNVVRGQAVAVHEYVAYTAQLATMSPALRDAVLCNVPTQAFTHPREIDEVMLALDPNRFAVKSYLHFVRVDEEARSFDQLLTGRFR